MSELTLYFDGRCPFCVNAMRKLKRWNTAGRLDFADITQPGFDPAFLGTDMAALNRELHGKTREGAVLVGIDCMLVAYTLVGRGWLVWPLRIPFLRPLLARGYRWFARHRYAISRRLGFRLPPRCDGEVCDIGNPFLR